MNLELRARLVRGDVSTDDVLPARRKHESTDPAVLAAYVFEHALPGFARTLRPGDAILCDGIFGIGSSREQAVTALQAAGVAAVIAPRFGAIFFRNAWNLGLPAVAADPAAWCEGDALTLRLRDGRIEGARAAAVFPPIPERLLELLRHGGLLRSLTVRA